MPENNERWDLQEQAQRLAIECIVFFLRSSDLRLQQRYRTNYANLVLECVCILLLRPDIVERGCAYEIYLYLIPRIVIPPDILSNWRQNQVLGRDFTGQGSVNATFSKLVEGS